ncbi:putative manganese-dependent inorganic diphosphatase [Coprothermobacteraceae bacterium]|nr:putative manganese-dependent inorganic diphosphatase [Coprothermobacteraceae bacterium]
MIHVVGHRNPDTDSIVSAVAYAYFKGDEYAPFRAGEANDESKALFELADTPLPPRLSTVRLTASDLMKAVKCTSLNEPLAAVLPLIEEQKIVPVLQGTKLAGILTEKDLLRVLQRELFTDDVSVRIRPDILERTLPGRFLTTPKELSGRPLVAASADEVVRERLGPETLVIMGNRWELIPALVEKGVRGVIFTMNLVPPSESLALLESAGICAYSSALHTFNTIRLLFIASPISEVYNSTVVAFAPSDGLSYLQRVTALHKHRMYPVVDEDGTFMGMVETSELANPPRKKVVLVDHNELNQGVDGLEEAQIVAIVDHHRLGGLVTHEPVELHMEPVGSTSTLVTKEFVKSGKKIPSNIALILLGGIISDTLNLNSVTTAPADVEMASLLEQRSPLGREELARRLFEVRVRSVRDNPDKLLNDFKIFKFGDTRVGIAQLEVPEASSLLRVLREAVTVAMERRVDEEKLDLGLFMLTDVTKRCTVLLAFGNTDLARVAWALPFRDGYELLPGVVSRKKQVVPVLQKAFGQ